MKIIPDRQTQDQWRASVVSHLQQVGASKEADQEAQNQIAELSGVQLTGPELGHFVDGKYLEDIVVARVDEKKVEGKHAEAKPATDPAKAGCGCLLWLIFVGFGIYFFWFSDTAKFMDSLK